MVKRLTAGAALRAVLRAFEATLLRLGLVSAARYMGPSGTAHGRVTACAIFFAADGNVLPRSSRVNPALTIYIWGLRLGDYLANQQNGRHRTE